MAVTDAPAEGQDGIKPQRKIFYRICGHLEELVVSSNAAVLRRDRKARTGMRVKKEVPCVARQRKPDAAGNALSLLFIDLRRRVILDIIDIEALKKVADRTAYVLREAFTEGQITSD